MPPKSYFLSSAEKTQLTEILDKHESICSTEDGSILPEVHQCVIKYFHLAAIGRSGESKESRKDRATSLLTELRILQVYLPQIPNQKETIEAIRLRSIAFFETREENILADNLLTAKTEIVDHVEMLIDRIEEIFTDNDMGDEALTPFVDLAIVNRAIRYFDEIKNVQITSLPHIADQKLQSLLHHLESISYKLAICLTGCGRKDIADFALSKTLDCTLALQSRQITALKKDKKTSSKKRKNDVVESLTDKRRLKDRFYKSQNSMFNNAQNLCAIANRRNIVHKRIVPQVKRKSELNVAHNNAEILRLERRREELMTDLIDNEQLLRNIKPGVIKSEDTASLFIQSDSFSTGSIGFHNIEEVNATFVKNFFHVMTTGHIKIKRQSSRKRQYKSLRKKRPSQSGAKGRAPIPINADASSAAMLTLSSQHHSSHTAENDGSDDSDADDVSDISKMKNTESDSDSDSRSVSDRSSYRGSDSGNNTGSDSDHE